MKFCVHRSLPVAVYVVLSLKVFEDPAQLQSEQGVINVISYKIEDHSHLLGELETSSRDFH